jgi:hypothetical protein
MNNNAASFEAVFFVVNILLNLSLIFYYNNLILQQCIFSDLCILLFTGLSTFCFIKKKKPNGGVLSCIN